MSIGTALHERTATLNRKQNWREWSGYLASSAYAPARRVQRHPPAAALIDVSPLYKYRVSGPDAVRLIDRVITRDATKIKPGQVIYTCWCNEAGKVLDDGTIARLDDDSFRWTSAEPHLRWMGLNSRGLDVTVDDVSEATAAIALQGPLAREVLQALTDADWTDLPYYRRRSARAGEIDFDVSRTGYTGDLGYELWVEAAQAVALWDRLVEVGRPFGIAAAGHAGAGHVAARGWADPDRRRLHERQARARAGSELLAFRDRPWPAGQLRQGNRLRRQARAVSRDGGGRAVPTVGRPGDRLGAVERLYEAQDLPIWVSPVTWRAHVPFYAGAARSAAPPAAPGARCSRRTSPWPRSTRRSSPPAATCRWSGPVEGRRGRVAAVVAPLPFFDPPRKRG